jgi:hypothetical protein
MCAKHWHMVPPLLRKHIWQELKPADSFIGIEPTEEWRRRTSQAVNIVAKKEGKPEVPECSAVLKLLILPSSKIQNF